jgi:general secretion pathway protein G
MELLLVLLIIAILAAMVVPRLAGRSEQARISAAKADIESNLSIALDLYELDNGTYPTTEQGLKALIEKPSMDPVPENWRGPYIKNARIPTDPWGNPYQYVSPGTRNLAGYDLWSSGPDKRSNSDDDIANWE